MGPHGNFPVVCPKIHIRHAPVINCRGRVSASRQVHFISDSRTLKGSQHTSMRTAHPFVPITYGFSIA